MRLQHPNEFEPLNDEDYKKFQLQYLLLAIRTIDALNPHRNGPLRKGAGSFLQIINTQPQENQGEYLLEALKKQEYKAINFVAAGHHELGLGELQKKATPAQAVTHLKQTVTVLTDIEQHFPKIKNDLVSKIQFDQFQNVRQSLSGSTIPVFQLKRKIVPKANLLSATLSIETPKQSVVKKYVAVSGSFGGKLGGKYCEHSVGIGETTYVHALRKDNKANVFPLYAGFDRAADTEVKVIKTVDQDFRTIKNRGSRFSSATIDMTSTYPACPSCLSVSTIYAYENKVKVNLVSYAPLRDR